MYTKPVPHRAAKARCCRFGFCFCHRIPAKCTAETRERCAFQTSVQWKEGGVCGWGNRFCAILFFFPSYKRYTEEKGNTQALCSTNGAQHPQPHATHVFLVVEAFFAAGLPMSAPFAFLLVATFAAGASFPVCFFRLIVDRLLVKRPSGALLTGGGTPNDMVRWVRLLVQNGSASA